MMAALRAFVIAFSMYSTLPMPRVEWTKENMRYALCFLPLVGAVCGCALMLWQFLCQRLGFGSILFGAGAAVLPVAITGGIHLDGFFDVIDALSSHQTKEKKLEILKDPHIGAFAIIGACCYFLLYFALFVQLGFCSQLWLVAAGYVISRAWGAFAVVTFPQARSQGLVRTFADGAATRTVQITMAVVLAIMAGLLLWQAPLLAAGCLGVSILLFVWFYFFCRREFGGITGDLAGYFIQLCELLWLAALVVMKGAMAWN